MLKCIFENKYLTLNTILAKRWLGKNHRWPMLHHSWGKALVKVV